MERRLFKRMKVNLKAERISGDQKHGVFIENISETGIHMITSSSKGHVKYTAGADVDLKLSLSSGETIDLCCKIRWSYLKTPPNGLTDSIGLEIIKPPVKYIEFVRSLR